ncbi:MAG: hypothetical protein IJP02_03475 [Oscillospiraceae bacterium]|nr:hypothetical protein [Oscillospiraceae bacterium]
MKKFLALLLAMMMMVSLVACGGEVVEEEVSDVSASQSEEQDSAIAADNEGAKITDEQVAVLVEAYNSVAPLFNEVFTAAEKNGWLNDPQTLAEIEAVNATLGVVGTALTEDMTMLDGANLDELPGALLQFAPELEKMLERVSVAYVAPQQ